MTQAVTAISGTGPIRWLISNRLLFVTVHQPLAWQLIDEIFVSVSRSSSQEENQSAPLPRLAPKKYWGITPGLVIA